MYHIVYEWKTDKIMLNVFPLGCILGAPAPWPTPYLLSGLQETMTFKERVLNVATGLVLNWFFILYGNIALGGGVVNVEDNFFGNIGLTHPTLFNTVFGLDYPKTTTPLAHYTGPLFLRSYPPLDSRLMLWLKVKERRSVIYISMGSMAELTVELGNSILNGIPSNYSIVWSLRESNRNILEGLKIDEKRIYVAGWVSQVTFLQHETVAMALLHCGIGGVQESLYYRVPVICIPTGNDQYDIAARVEGRFGVRIFSSEVTQESVSDAISKIRSGRFQDKVDKISIILRQGGGTKKAADLVEFYSVVGYEHGIPAAVKYKWSWITYYNVDVWAMLFAIAGLTLWISVECVKCCCLKCCSRLSKKKKAE